MGPLRADSVQTRLETLIALGRLLERVESSPVAIGADPYRTLVRQLKVVLVAGVPEPALHAVLDAHPATAELYENLHYRESGLSRSPLDRSVATELLAAEVIHRAARRGDAAA